VPELRHASDRRARYLFGGDALKSNTRLGRLQDIDLVQEFACFETCKCFPGGHLVHKADGILRGKKMKDTDVYVPVLTPDSDNCSITFDEHLAALLEDVEDPGQQMAVCDALCNIGLAEHKMYVRDNNKFQKHD
jgi:hypothetical protein